eukprot:6200459-Pleurochrysis_carterae.AAC.4
MFQDLNADAHPIGTNPVSVYTTRKLIKLIAAGARAEVHICTKQTHTLDCRRAALGSNSRVSPVRARREQRQMTKELLRIPSTTACVRRLRSSARWPASSNAPPRSTSTLAGAPDRVQEALLLATVGRMRRHLRWLIRLSSDRPEATESSALSLFSESDCAYCIHTCITLC